jgi:hypothetical protein
MDQPAPKKLRIPVALAVVVLASGAAACTSTPSSNDAAVGDAAVADADFDAGCVPPEVYDPSTRTCVPVV